MIEYKVKVYEDGDKSWYLNDKLHREDGPAVEWPNGYKSWYLNGQRHREDGPAVERADGSKFWYLNDEELTEQEFNNRTQVQELTIRELEQKLGYKIKIKGESYNESINK